MKGTPIGFNINTFAWLLLIIVIVLIVFLPLYALYIKNKETRRQIEFSVKPPNNLELIIPYIK